MALQLAETQRDLDAQRVLGNTRIFRETIC
jgi:hypothetical protein